MSLGAPNWQAVLTSRGGSPVTGTVPLTSLTLNRTLDDFADAQITVPLGAPRAPATSVCARIEPYRHELALYRNATLMFVGPVIPPVTSTRTQVTFSAKDLFGWFEVRTLDYSHDFPDADLSDIFRVYATEALLRDRSPNIRLHVISSGVRSSRTLDATRVPRAADELRELARSGVDFVMGGADGRELIVAGEDNLPIPHLGILPTEAFGDAEVAGGIGFATEQIVVGGQDPDFATQAVGVATATDATVDRYGLVQAIANEDGLIHNEECEEAAKSRLRFAQLNTLYPTGPLSSACPRDLAAFIPGARADLRVECGWRQIIGEMVLRKVAINVSWSESGVSETAEPTFTPLQSQSLADEG